jgi:hypothetical protein
VAVYADGRIDEGMLRSVAESVSKICGQSVCRCFCRFSLTTADPKLAELNTMGDVNCMCRDKSNGNEMGGQDKLMDMYGLTVNTTLPHGPDRYRFEIPKGDKLVTDGLMLTLDGGDRLSWPDSMGTGKGKKGMYIHDVSGSGFDGKVLGNVEFNSNEGKGSFRFGKHGVRGDRVIMEGLDISPRKHRALTLELWIKLASIKNARGWAFGNDASHNAHSEFDRSIIMHDTRFGPHPEVYPRAGDYDTMEQNGRSAIGVGNKYDASNQRKPRKNQWIHMVGVWDQEGKSYMYRNTVQYLASDYTINKDGGRDLVLGDHPFLRGHWVDAHIAVARVYGKALTEEEIVANYDFAADRFGIERFATPDQIWNKAGFNPNAADAAKKIASDKVVNLDLLNQLNGQGDEKEHDD